MVIDMENFFVCIFENNRFSQFKLDNIIHNSFNGFLSKDFSCSGESLYLPFVLSEEKYYFYSKNTTWEFTYNGNCLTEKVEIKNGDYFIASNGKHKYSLLITSSRYCSVSAKAYSISRCSKIFIGRSSEMNIVTDITNSISRKHAAIRVEESGKAYIEDLSGKTGVYVNNKKERTKELVNGDEIFIMGVTIIYFENMLVIPANTKTNGMKLLESIDVLAASDNEKKVEYVRTPRIYKSLENGKITIDPPTAPQKTKEMPFILTAGPSLTMSFAMLASLAVTISNAIKGDGISSIITSGVMAISMLLGALFWPKLLRDYNKRQQIANEKYRCQKYLSYLDEKEDEIKKKYDRNIRIWNEILLPSPTEQIGFITDQKQRLWERTPDDDDFLSVRLGLGQRSFEVDIQVPQKGFVLEDDAIVDKAREISNKYSTLHNVPISISLKDKKIIGVVGDYYNVAKCIISNVVSLHAPDEVKLVIVCNAFQKKKLSVFNNLPHSWSSDKKRRFVAADKSEVYALFSEIDESITTRELQLSKEDLRIPHYVVLVFDQTLIDDIPFKKKMLDKNNTFGVSTVFFSEKYKGIPKECEAVIQKNADACGMYVKNENDNHFLSFEFDHIDDCSVDELIYGLSKIDNEVDLTVASVPDSVSFLDMYKVGNIDSLNIQSHWRSNLSHKSLAVPIGVKSGGEVFSIDIHEKYHGCHGLVAGTTGSGKSEFLQALILSLMINYSPEEVAFVLVDFKGGDMARPFLKSPHLAATISNLSGNTLYRALVSLEAEIKRRQALFNESALQLSVDKIDINSYHKYYKEQKLNKPLPHLVIIIDEFAQLKTQYPDFLAKLIDIAQVGRSLGIHLVLATQKPNGVVDPQIWSNSRFKVCLKVTDKQDSVDMINRPDAALIKNPGRAIIQIGYDEIFESIQSGYSGAEYIPLDEFYSDDSISVHMINNPGEILHTAKSVTKNNSTGKTQLEEIMLQINNLGKHLGLNVEKLWLPVLSSELRFEECETVYNCLCVDKTDTSPLGQAICGMVDVPQKQEQKPLVIDFINNGHLAIYGSSGTGKTTAVQSLVFALALKYSPQLFNLFVLDFGGGGLVNLSNAPHCVDYVTDLNEKDVNSLLNKIDKIIKQRRSLFSENNCANYTSYIQQGNQLPFMLVILDNYSVFREKMYKSEDLLVQLIASARSCGVYFVITGNSKGAIYYKVTDHISSKIVFALNDSGAYRDILNVSTPIIPDNIRGRGLTVQNKAAVEMQIAVPFDCENETERTLNINAVYAEMAKLYEKANISDFNCENEMDFTDLEDDNSFYSTDIYEKRQMEPLMPVQQTDSLVFGNQVGSNQIQGFDITKSRRFIVSNPINNTSVYDTVLLCSLESFSTVFAISNKSSAKYSQVIHVEDIDKFIQESFVDTTNSQENAVLIIDDFCDFYDRISDDALALMLKCIKNSSSMAIITIDDMQRINLYRDTELFIHLVRVTDGLIIGGSVNDELASLLHESFNDIPVLPRKKQLREDQALIFSGSRSSYINLRTEDT